MTDTEHNGIISYIKNKTYNKTNILCNPTLGSMELMIRADGDLIVDDELIDFKTSIHDIGNSNEEYIQLVIYALLYYIKAGIWIFKMTITNILLGYEKTINIENYDYKPLLQILSNRVGNRGGGFTTPREPTGSSTSNSRVNEILLKK